MSDSMTDNELRAECLKRGYVMHSVVFSGVAQTAIRELTKLRDAASKIIADYDQATKEGR